LKQKSTSRGPASKKGNPWAVRLRQEGSSGSELKKVKDAVVHRVSAEDMAKKQREISVSEFFAKNRHLLGFDSPRKALLTAVKEAVDNSLDACEEARILPDIEVKIEVVGGLKAPESPKEEKKPEPKEGEKPAAEAPKGPSVAQAERFIVTVTGQRAPASSPSRSRRVFAKLLYGSKFHRLRMSRGQQGIGISAAGLYGQLTTGKPVRVTSQFHEKKPARYVEITIDTAKNEPRVLANREATDWTPDHRAPASRSSSKAATRRAARRSTSSSSRPPSRIPHAGSSTSTPKARRSSSSAW
jgi:DNA topoisomerase-6 subunit B